VAGQKAKPPKKKSSWLASRSRPDRSPSAPAAGKIVHVTDKTFRDLVLQADVPVLVDFWADWSAPCRAMAPGLEELASQYAGLARVAQMNIDKNRVIPARYDIKTLPTVLVFKGGEILQTFIGAPSKGELSKVIAWAMREE